MSEPVNITFSNGIDSLTTLNNVVSDEKSEYTDGILKFINSSYIYDISDDLTIDNYIVDKVLAEVVERGIHKFVLSDKNKGTMPPPKPSTRASCFLFPLILANDLIIAGYDQ